MRLFLTSAIILVVATQARYHSMSEERYVEQLLHDGEIKTEYSNLLPNELCKSHRYGPLYFKIKNLCGDNHLFPQINDNEILWMTHKKVENGEKLEKSDILTLCDNEMDKLSNIRNNYVLDIFSDEKLFFYC